MLLGLKQLKLIKPTGSVDDYESGVRDGDTPAEKHKAINDAIYNSMGDLGSLSIPEIMKITGSSQGGTWGILNKLKKAGKIKMVRRKTNGAIKPVHYYSLIEC